MVSCYLSVASRITSVVCMIDASVEFNFLLVHCVAVKHWLAVR